MTLTSTTTRKGRRAPLVAGRPGGVQDPADFSPLIAQLRAAADGRAPFCPVNSYLPTGFSSRLMGVLAVAMATGQWYLVTALSGDGKSKTLAEARSIHPAVVVERSDGRRIRHVPILSTRVSSGVQSADRLMYALAAGLGAVPPLSPAAFRVWLVDAIATAEVALIVIDDAHEMTIAQLSYLRELTGQLAEAGSEPSVVLLAAIDSKDPRACKPWTLIAKRDLIAEQFNNRLDGCDPVVFIEGLSRREVGDVLASWEVAYRDRFPELELTPWTESLFGWLTEPRNDRLGTGRIRMRHLRNTVNGALAMAWAEGRTGLSPDGMDLYASALRITLRGYSVAVVEAAGDEDEEPPW